MKLPSIKQFIKNIIFKLQCLLFKKLISSKNAWQIFDDAGLDGFGVNLVRLYFPVYYTKETERQTFSAETKNKFTKFIDLPDRYDNLNSLIAREIPEIMKISVKEIDETLPYLDNYFFGIYDAAILAALMQSFKPAKIVEIGSGISTRYIRCFNNKFALNAEIECIDPFPRVNIEAVADKIIRQPLEDVIAGGMFDLSAGDFIFMDGSHYVFQGNDTLTFFFKLLPSLPRGVFIHIHDIYLPYDYSANVSRQLWTEQYILAAMMAGGFEGFEVVYPAYFLSQADPAVKQMLAEAAARLDQSQFGLDLKHKEGYSFWIKTV